MIFSRQARSDLADARLIYAAVVAQARDPAFFTALGVPDTLNGRFEMMALHLFAVTERLVGGRDPDPVLARLIGEVFVEDMDLAFRDMGVGDTKVPRRMKTLYGAFGGRMKAYREGAAGTDGMLVSALERNIFPEGGGDHPAAALGEYLRACLAAFAAATTAEIRRGTLPFAAVPTAFRTGGER